MKNLIKLSLAFVFLPCILAGNAGAQKVDLAPDEAVLAELQKRADAKRDPLGKKDRDRLDARNVCIERLNEKVIVIGFFASDRGCRLDGAFVDSRYFESTDAALSKNALVALGWREATKAERERLASYWVQKGLLLFFTVLQTKNKDLQDNQFHPPRAASNEKGEITVTLWMQMPSRSSREKGFQHVEYIFANDGGLTGNATLEALSIDR